MNTIPLHLSERQVKARLRSLLLHGRRPHCKWCDSHKVKYLKKEDRYHCKICRKKTSLRSTAWFRSIKISLVLFVNILVAWINEYSVQVTATTLSTSEVTVRRYYRLFRIHIAKPLDFNPKISVQVDEAYFGQFRRQANYYHGFKKYTVVEKVCVAGMVCPETGLLHAEVIRSTPKGEEIRQMIRKYVPKDVTIYADGSYIYTSLRSSYNLVQQTHDLGFHNAYYIEGCWGYMKRKLFKIYHHFDRKYAEEYVAELVWRFNNRKESKNHWDILRKSL